MAYQDDFRNKVLQALKAKNLAVDISQEATQQAIVEEAQNVANQESRPMSPEEMKLVLQDVANQLAAEKQQFTAQSADVTAFFNFPEGGQGGSYSGGGIANSVMNKDIMIIPTAGTANSINTLSQIDFKIISNPNAYGVIDPNEVKSSLYNWGERITGNTYDTPVLGLGGAWNGVSYTPTPQWGLGGSQGSGIAGSINPRSGFGQIIYFKPASSTIYAGLFNDLGINVDYTTRSFTLTGYNAAVPGSFPAAGVAVTFGGIGNSGDLIILGSPTESQVNTVKFLSPVTVSNTTATDTLTLSLSNAVGGTAGTLNLVGNGSTQQYVLSTNSNIFAAGDIFYASGTGHTHLVRLPLGTSNTYLFSNGSVPSWTGSIAANTVAVNPTGSGSTILYPLLNNAAGAGSAVSTDIDFSVDPGNNILRYATGSFYVGTAVSTALYTSAAGLIFKPAVDSTFGIQLQTSTGGTFVNLDTTNKRVGIGLSNPSYALDVLGYTNVATGSSYLIGGASVLSNNTLGTGVLFSSIITAGIITSGSWSATAITGFYGGTGYNSYTTGDILVGAGSTFIKLQAVATGSFLASQGTGTAPSYLTLASTTVGFASVGNSVRVQDAGSVGAVYYIPFSNLQTGAIGLSTNSALQFNATNGNLSATQLTGTLQTASQPNVTTAASLTTVGTIGTGVWQGSTIGTTYGGTGSNFSATGNTNKLTVLGTVANGYAQTTIDGANSGYFLMANGNITAPTFSNSTSAAFTFSGLVNFNTVVPQSANQPTSANELANKAYVDSISGGLDPHASVRLTTIAAIGGSYRQAGTSGSTWGAGDYIIAATSAELIGSMVGLDTPASGIALTNGQRVLVKDGVTGGYASGTGAFGAFPTTYGGFAASWVANGIYTVQSYGGAATSGWLLIRATDTDNGSGIQELQGGTFTFVEEGTTYADNAFVCTNDTSSYGPIGFGATQISWSAFSGGASLAMGQGLSKSGNTIAANFNLAQSTTVNANLSNGFAIGGARSGSVGSSSYATFIVTSASPSTNTLTGAGDGFTLTSGIIQRTLSVTGSNITLTGGGFTLTLGSNSTASFNGQTLALAASMGNLTFDVGNITPSASTHYVVQSGAVQYHLSTSNTTFGVGDLYYGGGSGFTALLRLPLASAVGTSVLVRDGATGPKWGTIALGDNNFVSGQLTLTNGGTGANLTAVNGGAVYSTGSVLAITAAGTAGSVLMSTGAGAPVWQQITLSNTASVSGQLSLVNGGTGANLTAVNGGAVYSTGSVLAVTAAGTAGSVLMSTGGSAPVWQQITLSNANSVSGTLGIANGGTNAGTTNFTSNGVVIYDSANTRLASAVGLTMTGGVGLSVTGTTTSTGGFFIAGNSVISSIAANNTSYGAITLSTASSVGGTSYFTNTSSSITLNYPGTGITGSATAGQVAYFGATSYLVGNAAMTFAPAGSGGSSFNLAPTSASATAMYIYAANTSGNILDATVGGSTRFSVDWKGMATHTASASGFTGLIVSGGRTILAAPTTNYATLNLAASSAVNPGAGNTQVGDLWFNGTNLYFRKDATTNFDLLVGSVSGSGTANKIAKWSTTTNLTDSNISDAGLGMTITAGSAVGVGLGSTAYLTIQSLAGDEAAGIKNSAYLIRGIQSATNSNLKVFSVDIAGNLRATTKSFDIPHPTKEGMRLVYGVLEGPEHGVYHRGTVEGKGILQVNLPEYWHKLVGDQYTIQLTPWGNYNVSIDTKTENYFTIQLVGDFLSRKFKNIKVDYIVHGSRLDAPLDIEQ